MVLSKKILIFLIFLVGRTQGLNTLGYDICRKTSTIINVSIDQYIIMNCQLIYICIDL